MANLFLCHASEDKPKVEPIHLALVKAGHSVFYDDRSLHPGGDYQQRIYEAIEECVLFIFIASKASLRPGKFTLSELDLAQRRWPDPTNRVLPVVIEQLDLSELPSYLTAVTVLQVRGNAAVEVRTAVDRLLAEPRKRKPRVLALTLTIGAVSLTVSFAILRLQAPGSGQPPPCRHPDHGVESYVKEFVVDRVSPWMGGGFSQDPWCKQAIAGLQGEYPGGAFTVVGKSESKKNTCPPFNCPQYQYICNIRVQAEPVYALKSSPACK